MPLVLSRCRGGRTPRHSLRRRTYRTPTPSPLFHKNTPLVPAVIPQEIPPSVSSYYHISHFPTTVGRHSRGHVAVLTNRLHIRSHTAGRPAIPRAALKGATAVPEPLWASIPAGAWPLGWAVATGSGAQCRARTTPSRSGPMMWHLVAGSRGEARGAGKTGSPQGDRGLIGGGAAGDQVYCAP